MKATHCNSFELYIFRYFRMSPDRFDHLLSLVNPLIEKQTTMFQKPIGPAERLAITLRFLATCDSQQTLSFNYRVGKSTISKIVKETSEAIYTVLKDDYMKPPQNEAEWQQISSEFEEKWNMPNVLGCIDGKHIRIECPKMSGTQYYNYKGFFSIVLMAVCDANYCFTLIDLGQYGSNNDSGVLANSKLGEYFENDMLKIPKERKVGSSQQLLPYFLLGDEIFPLKMWLMRPYPGKGADEEQRIYNYRHSRARRCIENAFGILSARWRIFQKPIRAKVENVEAYTLACLTLHNYLRLTNNASYTSNGFVDSEDSTGNLLAGVWREAKAKDQDRGALVDLPKVRGSRCRADVLEIRD